MTDTSPSHSIARILSRQREWSLRTFGPGRRTQWILRYIEEECARVDQSNHELTKCIYVLIMALDLCWRSGADLDQIELALHAAMTANESSKWPPIGLIVEDAKINHVRPPMPRYHVYATVQGSRYMGEFTAKTKEEAIKKAEESDAMDVCLCHSCSSECEDPQVISMEAEEATDA